MHWSDRYLKGLKEGSPERDAIERGLAEVVWEQRERGKVERLTHLASIQNWTALAESLEGMSLEEVEKQYGKNSIITREYAQYLASKQ